jgi:hypothetical protein
MSSKIHGRSVLLAAVVYLTIAGLATCGDLDVLGSHRGRGKKKGPAPFVTTEDERVGFSPHHAGRMIATGRRSRAPEVTNAGSMIVRVLMLPAATELVENLLLLSALRGYPGRPLGWGQVTKNEFCPVLPAMYATIARRNVSAQVHR